MKSYHQCDLYLSLVLVISSLVSLVGFASLHAISLQQKDYTIKDFGIKDGTPFMLVEGTAGGSYDPSMGDEGYEAYVFDTDKGIFQVSVAEGVYKNGTPYYLTDQVSVKNVKINECLSTAATDSIPSLANHTVGYVDQNANFTKVNKVYTIQIRIDDPDKNCQTGEHINKIYSNGTKVSP